MVGCALGRLCALPVGWHQLADFGDHHVGQAFEHVGEVFGGLVAVPAAAFDDRVDHSASPSGLGVADEEPVFLAQGGRANGVLDHGLHAISPKVTTIPTTHTMVPGEGVEPSLPCGNWILSPARLPIPPSGHCDGMGCFYFLTANER